jgi:phosphoserine phosphatase|tara:strand:+ start:116 stop:457 length:342 start_codon:yes stop_codon:yes gene_type:complete
MTDETHDKWLERNSVIDVKNKPKLTIAFDVDGTLITEDYRGPEPRYDIIHLYHWFERQGHKMYIWSGGGTDYAQRWAEKLGLGAEVIVKEKREGIDIAVDDCEANLAPTMIYV